MARTALTATTVTEAGIDPTAVDVAANLTDGNSFVWAPHRVVFVANGDDTTLTVSVPMPGTVGRSALAIADVSGTVSAAGYKVLGPFGPEFRQADGSVYLNYSGADASVTVAVLDV